MMQTRLKNNPRGATSSPTLLRKIRPRIADHQLMKVKGFRIRAKTKSKPTSPPPATHLLKVHFSRDSKSSNKFFQMKISNLILNLMPKATAAAMKAYHSSCNRISRTILGTKDQLLAMARSEFCFIKASK
jgi:hypothetical protein